MFHVFALSLVLIFNFIHVCCGACYARDGTVLSGGYLPCDSTASESACCLLDEGDGGPADICTTAGLCYRQDGIPGILYQDACTDKNWASSSCPKFCNNSTSGSMVLQTCNDTEGTWCCREPGASDCCSNSFSANIGVLLRETQSIIAVTAATVIPSSVVQTVTMTTTQAVTVTTTQTSDATGAACPNDSTTIVGASVGASLGVALLASLIMLFWREKTRPTGEQQYEAGFGQEHVPVESNSVHKGLMPPVVSQYSMPHELHDGSRPVEAP